MGADDVDDVDAQAADLLLCTLTAEKAVQASAGGVDRAGSSADVAWEEADVAGGDGESGPTSSTSSSS